MSFPENFIWGCASSAYQTEGAAYESDKGKSIWDVSCEEKTHIFEGHTGEVACDHYHRWEEDFSNLQKMGVKHFRFSVSWPRLLPQGTGKISRTGADFYDRLVDGMLERGITPYCTLYHWDLPYELYKKGGFLNADMEGWFSEYVQQVCRLFGDRVRTYFTFNEPECIIGCGLMEGNHSPYLKLPMRQVLQAAHYLLLANGSACRVIRSLVPQAQIGMTHACALPLPQCPEDEADAEKMAFSPNGTLFNNAWFNDPVLFGRYPQEIADAFGVSFDIREGDMLHIREKQDFIGLNIYHGRPVARDVSGKLKKIFPRPEVGRSSMNWNLTPESLYYGSKYFYNRYHIPLMITENGVALTEWKCEDGSVKDACRCDYISRYAAQLERAVGEGVDVRGYFYWSLLDNFEWSEGYNKRFGLVYVDYDTLERTPKSSAELYARIVRTNGACIGRREEEIR